MLTNRAHSSSLVSHSNRMLSALSVSLFLVLAASAVHAATTRLSPRSLCPPSPFRTLPRLDVVHGVRYPELDEEFLREWCQPAIPIVFPAVPTSYRNRVPLGQGPRTSGEGSAVVITNPHRGVAYEGGSLPILFPGQGIEEVDDDSSEDDIPEPRFGLLQRLGRAVRQ